MATVESTFEQDIDMKLGTFAPSRLPSIKAEDEEFGEILSVMLPSKSELESTRFWEKNKKRTLR